MNDPVSVSHSATSVELPTLKRPTESERILLDKLDEIDRRLHLITARLVRLEEMIHGTYGFPYK